MATKSSSGDTSIIHKYMLTKFWQENQYWKYDVILSVDGTNVTRGENKWYSEKGKEYLDKFLETKIKNEKSIHRL